MVSQGFFVVIRGCVYQYVSVGCVSNPDNCKASECLSVALCGLSAKYIFGFHGSVDIDFLLPCRFL